MTPDQLRLLVRRPVLTSAVEQRLHNIVTLSVPEEWWSLCTRWFRNKAIISPLFFPVSEGSEGSQCYQSKPPIDVRPPVAAIWSSGPPPSRFVFFIRNNVVQSGTWLDCKEASIVPDYWSDNLALKGDESRLSITSVLCSILLNLIRQCSASGVIFDLWFSDCCEITAV